MDLRTILDRFARGAISFEEAQKQIAISAIEHVEDIAKLDVGREPRKGLPEIILAERKEYADTVKIAVASAKRSGRVVVSRIKKRDLKRLVSALQKKGLKVETGRNSTTILVIDKPAQKNRGTVGVVAAGTSDIGVAEEARLVAEAMGCKAITSYDVGIAGMHRLFPALKDMLSKKVGAIVVVA
ncbi:MAG: hypothetical protein QXJ74_00400, partial [Nitrososphaera sp.]